MHLGEGQQLLEQAVARSLERPHRALEALEEVRPDEPDDLVLAVVLERVDALVRPLVVGERVVDGKAEQRLVS